MHPSTRLPEITTSRGLLALSPVAVFLCLYLVVSIAIGDFYKMPLSVALLVASVWSIVIYRRGGTLVERIETFSRSAGHANILYMIWIFILAGAFAALAKEIGAIDATVNFTLRFFPSQFIVPALFVASCFISLSIGTSVGTVVALTPLAVEMANASGACLSFYVAVVLGGAFSVTTCRLSPTQRLPPHVRRGARWPTSSRPTCGYVSPPPSSHCLCMW